MAGERGPSLSLTGDMKDELVRRRIEQPSQIAAEAAALLRFAGGLHLVGGRILVEAEVDSLLIAHRLRTYLQLLYGSESSIVVVSGGALKRGKRYVLRVVKDADQLARQAGLIDGRGRPVRGLPPQIVGAGIEEGMAAWRGAFLARGSLLEPGRSATLEITAPGPEAALALVGCARRIDVASKARQVRGSDRVVIRESDSIGRMIESLGAPKTFALWQARREKREARGSANRLANFDDANLRRSARAAVTASARVGRAFEILGDDVPDHLHQAGELRVKHKQASLEELGQQVDPPLTKDAIAGRIRRLLAMADKAAADRGIPGTESALTLEMLEDG